MYKRQLLDGVDDEDVDRGGGGFEFEAELLLHGGEDAEVVGLRVAVDAPLGSGFDAELVGPGEASAVDDRAVGHEAAPYLVCQIVHSDTVCVLSLIHI